MKAYLVPNIYNDRDIGITCDSKKIATYLSRDDPPRAGEPVIKSWHRVEGVYYYFPPCCMIPYLTDNN